MSIRICFTVSALLASMLAAQAAVAGTAQDAHGNVGYDTLAECEAAVAAGTAKFYKPYTHNKTRLHVGEARVAKMSLKDVIIPEGAAKAQKYATNNYKNGSCDLGVPAKAGQYGVAPQLHGKYVPYSPDMAVNAYYNKAGQLVRTTMEQCNNQFSAAFPRPIASAPVAAASIKAAPVAAAPVAPAPVAPAPVQVAAASAKGSFAYGPALGIAALVAAGAIIANNGDSGTTGTR